MDPYFDILVSVHFHEHSSVEHPWLIGAKRHVSVVLSASFALFRSSCHKLHNFLGPGA